VRTFGDKLKEHVDEEETEDGELSEKAQKIIDV
jgi:hypothetical protein